MPEIRFHFEKGVKKPQQIFPRKQSGLLHQVRQEALRNAQYERVRYTRLQHHQVPELAEQAPAEVLQILSCRRQLAHADRRTIRRRWSAGRLIA